LCLPEEGPDAEGRKAFESGLRARTLNAFTLPLLRQGNDEM
jgi:hypothetical protein